MCWRHHLVDQHRNVRQVRHPRHGVPREVFGHPVAKVDGVGTGQQKGRVDLELRLERFHRPESLACLAENPGVVFGVVLERSGFPRLDVH